MITVKPLDIIAVAGLTYMPHHWLIQWNSKHRWVHNAVVLDDEGNLYNPVFTGIRINNIERYQGREIAICRYRNEVDKERLLQWCAQTREKSRGYDYLSWLGFLFGHRLFEDDTRWGCSEFAYWMLQENGYRVTNLEETFPYPHFPVYNPLFEIVWRGVFQGQAVWSDGSDDK